MDGRTGNRQSRPHDATVRAGLSRPGHLKPLGHRGGSRRPSGLLFSPSAGSVSAGGILSGSVRHTRYEYTNDQTRIPPIPIGKTYRSERVPSIGTATRTVTPSSTNSQPPTRWVRTQDL